MFEFARVRRLGAQLGLLAVLLIALAPLMSQWRAADSDWSWLGELGCHEGAAATSPVAIDLPQADACGYCSLLHSSPGLPTTNGVAELGRPHLFAVSWASLTSQRVAVRTLHAPPRAPPCSFDAYPSPGSAIPWLSARAYMTWSVK